MAIPVDYFQPESFQQANPFLSGFGATQGIIGQNLQNQQLSAALQGQNINNQIMSAKAQYAMPEEQQALLQAQLRNQILQPQAQYAPQMTQAQLALARTMPGYYSAMANEAGARAGFMGAQTNLLKQQTPYMVEKAQADVFNDPLLSRANQLAMAQQQSGTNHYLAQSLQNLGFSGDQNNSAPSQIPFAGASPVMPNAMNAPRMMTGNPMQNYLMFGSPLSPYLQMQLQAIGKGMETQQSAAATDYSKALTDSQNEANIGTQLSNLADQFQQSYNATNEKGFAGGRLPAVSSDAQAADNASQNMAALVAKTIAGGRVTNYEMQYISNLKPNRAMNPQTAQMVSDFWKQKALRMNEQQAFLNTAKNEGVDIYTANTLWNQYNNQRPVYDFANRQPNTQYQNSWNDFLTPQAVNAAQTGQRYVMPPQFKSQVEAKNWFKSLSPSDKQIYVNQIKGGQ